MKKQYTKPQLEVIKLITKPMLEVTSLNSVNDIKWKGDGFDSDDEDV